jgi:putative ABC transport system ATP-binding protein
VDGAHLSVAPGEVAAVTGQSGSGKSSLLHCLAGVLPAARGQVRCEGRVLGQLTDEEMSALRRERFGFVFRYGELLPELTVEENAALPLRPAGYWTGSVRASCASGGPRRCRAVRVSVSRSPGPWCTARRWSSRTSRPDRRTAPTQPPYCGSSSIWQALGVVAVAALGTLPLVGRRIDPELIRRD